MVIFPSNYDSEDSYKVPSDTTQIKVEKGAFAVIDLNGCSIDNATGDAIVNGGTLYISGTGSVKSSAAGSAAIANLPGADCHVSGGTYRSSQWYTIKNLGEMDMYDGVTVQGVDGNVSSLVDNGWYGASDTVAQKSYKAADYEGRQYVASLNIYGGTFIGGSNSMSVVKNDDYGGLTIFNGSFDSTANKGSENAATILNWNVAYINNGEFKGAYPISNGSNGQDSADKGILEINGGTFTSTGDGVGVFGYANGSKDSDGSVTITGGTFNGDVTAKKGSYGIEIWAGKFANNVSDLVRNSDSVDSAVVVKVEKNGASTYYAVGSASQDEDTINYIRPYLDAMGSLASGDTVTFLKAKGQGAESEDDLDYDGYVIPSGVIVKNESGLYIKVYDEVIKSGSELTVKNVVTFDSQGGTYVWSVMADASGKVTLPTDNKPERDGYTFAGWNTRSDGKGTTYQPGATITDMKSDITLYAQWTKNETPTPATTTYMVTYNANGGKNAPEDGKTDDKGKITLPKSTPTRADYTFTGWNTSSNGKGTSYDAGKTYTLKEDTTLYAQWERNTVTLDRNGASGTAQVLNVSGGQVTLPTTTPTRDGYTFAGWNTKADGTGKSYKAGDKVSADGSIRLYAQWTKNETPVTPTTFSDVVSGSWYQPGVTFCANRGIMTGYTRSDGTPTGIFGVGRTLTRGELATILWRMSEPEAASAYTSTVQAATRNQTGLRGVRNGQFYTAAANWAVKANVIKGYDDGDFGADDPVTCEQLLTILARYTGHAGGANASSLNGFTDGSDVSGWARRSVAWGKNIGLVAGYKNDDGSRTLRPQEDIHRERIATIIMNAYRTGLLK